MQGKEFEGVFTAYITKNTTHGNQSIYLALLLGLVLVSGGSTRCGLGGFLKEGFWWDNVSVLGLSEREFEGIWWVWRASKMERAGLSRHTTYMLEINYFYRQSAL